MQCLRCRNAMVFEVYYRNGIKFPEWRCVVCGNVVDAYILANRLRQTPPKKQPLLASKLRIWMGSQNQDRNLVKEQGSAV